MTDRSAHLLRRRTTDRVIGGVAGGLGDYFNVDPLLIRIGFVGLIIFGGAGLVLYLIAWLLLPAEGQDASMAESFFRRLGLTPSRIGWIALALILLVLIFNMPIGGPLDGSGTVFIGPLPGLNPAALWALAIIVTGIVVIRRRETAPSLAPAAIADVAPPATPTVRPVPRPRSPLGWYVLAATLIALGLLAIVSQMAHVEVAPGQFFGAALAVIGIGLVVGAWWGRARVLILLALLLMPVAVPASFITAPLEGGVGDLRYTPASPAELRDEYRLLGGRLVLDLTKISRGTQPIHIAASVAVGELVVVLPPDASVQIDARVGAGSTILFDARQVGTSLQDRSVRHEFRGASYILDLEAGIGEVQVMTRSTGSN
jgi:phage shock protein PspC (stress-responsive transcriptional regulator)